MDFANPHFEEPGWLLLAVFAPALLFVLQRYAARGRRRQLARMASPRFVEELTLSHSPIRRRCKETLLLLAVAMVGLAMARPQWGELDSANQWSNEDVVIAFDCSQSMLATDILPNRLQRAKLAVQDFVRRHGRGRFGLVAFAGSAFLQCPLTLDYDAFERALQAMDEKSISVPGTDVGRALADAFKAMDKNSRRKLVVLVTDGEDLEKTGIKAAELLATNAVVVFTVGVGTPNGAEIRVNNAAGQPELLRDEKGQTVRSRLDQETLQTIAKVTGGNYYPLGARGEGLDRVRFAVQSLNRVAGATRTHGIERFHFPLAAALLFIVIESLLGTRRKEAGANRSVMENAGALRASTILLLITGVSLSASGTSLEKSNPPSPEVREKTPTTAADFYNAGARKLGEGKLADAELLLRSALAQWDDKVQPTTLYNLGQVRYTQGEQLLEKEPSAEAFAERTRRIAEAAEQVMNQANTAMAGDDMERLVTAYLSGRGVRREARAALEALNRAMATYGATLLKWRRSLGDFQSVTELNPADTNAVYNARIVEQAIARLIDQIRRMQMCAAADCSGGSKFSETMKKLKGRIPNDKLPGGLAEDDEDDMPMNLPRGVMEGPSKEGKEMKVNLTPEEAAGLLRGMRLNERQGLPMPRGEAGQPRNRPGRTW